MKKHVEDLEKRIIQLGLSSSDEVEAKRETVAKFEELFRRMTEEERMQAAKLFKAVENGELSREKGEAEMHELFAKAGERN
jgi:hypothetical protein